MLRLDWFFKPMVLSKRKVIKIPLGEDEALSPSKLHRLYVDGKSHKSTGAAFTPSVVRSGDEFAKCQWFVPAIRFHRFKYRPDSRASAMGCSPHSA